MNKLRSLAAATLFAIGFVASGQAQDKSIVVASTTSTQDSGLYDYLLPKCKEKTGVTVKVVAKGTGQALDTARRCDADVLFVHPKAQEKEILERGLRRKALSLDVQRLRSDRAGERSRAWAESSVSSITR